MRTFIISDKEEAELDRWDIEHKKTCEWRNKNRFLTYCFTPIGLGDAIQVECRCGEKVSITDTENW